MYIKSYQNQAANNVMTNNSIGVYFLGNANANSLQDNQITYNWLYGVYVKNPSDATNFLNNNTVYRNKKDVFIMELARK